MSTKTREVITRIHLNNLPEDETLTRLADACMARQMDQCARQQRDRQWKLVDNRLTCDVRVVTPGHGELGERVDRQRER